ncbi:MULTISPECIES: hypothetical protein [Sulfitobacter]|uniref:Uncharacterized protein n=1 Tax=Sulfitobacter profundi TaxID=2679961 RepID=A0ABW1YYH7_9RHOB|nr:hypothetical protein [Sulfitobacter indolifex]
MRRRPLFQLMLLLDVILFGLASFGANYLLSYEKVEGETYLIVMAVAIAIYLVVRVVGTSSNRVALLAHSRLSDRIADSLMSYGLEDTYNMQRRVDKSRRNSDTQDTIEEAQIIKLAANSGASYLSRGVNRHWKYVQKRLEKGIPVKIILLDPNSSEKAFKNKLNNGNEGADSKLPLEDIIRTAESHPDFQVRFASTGMSCTVFLSHEVAYFDPYHVAMDGGRISNLFFCMKFRSMLPTEGISHFEMLNKHFETLWGNSITLDSWMESKKREHPIAQETRE